MLRALSDILDEAFCKGVIGLSCGLFFVRSVQKCVQSLLGHLRYGFSQMLHWALSMSQAAGDCKISTTAAINSRTSVPGDTFAWCIFLI